MFTVFFKLDIATCAETGLLQFSEDEFLTKIPKCSIQKQSRSHYCVIHAIDDGDGLIDLTYRFGGAIGLCSVHTVAKFEFAMLEWD